METMLKKKLEVGSLGEVVQLARVLDAKTDGLSSIPRAHIVKRENRLPQIDL